MYSRHSLVVAYEMKRTCRWAGTWAPRCLRWTRKFVGKKISSLWGLTRTPKSWSEYFNVPLTDEQSDFQATAANRPSVHPLAGRVGPSQVYRGSRLKKRKHLKTSYNAIQAIDIGGTGWLRRRQSARTTRGE